MADQKVNIKVTAQGAKKAQNELKGVEGAIGKMGKAVGVASAVYFGARGLIAGFSSVITLAGELEQAEKKHPEGDPIKESSIKSKEKFLDEVLLQLESRLEAFSRAARKPEQIAALKKNITEL